MRESIETLPVIDFAGILFCPHCGVKLYVYDEPYIGKCPHLVFAYGWGPEDMILAIRPDYAKVLLKNLIESDSYKSSIEEDESEPIREDLQERFLKGRIDPHDYSALELTIYFNNPHINFPSLIPECSAVFKDDRMYSGVHLIVSCYLE